jgi:hypothetical protein
VVVQFVGRRVGPTVLASGAPVIGKAAPKTMRERSGDLTLSWVAEIALNHYAYMLALV